MPDATLRYVRPAAMLFTSGEFLFVFLPIVQIGFFWIARRSGHRIAAAWLVLSSLVFYGFWRPEYTALLIISIAVNYCFGRSIQKLPAAQVAYKRVLLAIAVGVNLLVLAYFKYFNFLIATIESLTGAHIDPVQVTLPIGISFFTFTQIAYLVDSAQRKVREPDPVHYALFVSYFPHLISGPVLHHAEMMPQFRRPETYVPRMLNFLLGLSFLSVGLAKKVLIADSAAPVANAMFDTVGTQTPTFFAAWQGVLAYTVQIYFDFSGYSDMAVGLSLLFGVQLPYNFNSPYKSHNIIEFWRRWHMTLSRFLRDYLYFALGGNRRGSARRYFNLAITMLLGGLWHGASWTFVVWGGLHGTFLVINHGWQHLSQRLRGLWRLNEYFVVRIGGLIASMVLTLACTMVAWAFFRAKSIGDAMQVVTAMFRFTTNALQGNAANMRPMVWLAAAMVLALIAPNSQQLIDGMLRRRLEGIAEADGIAFIRGCAVGISIVLIITLACISASRNVTEFIYFNF